MNPGTACRSCYLMIVTLISASLFSSLISSIVRSTTPTTKPSTLISAFLIFLYPAGCSGSFLLIFNTLYSNIRIMSSVFIQKIEYSLLTFFTLYYIIHI
nr:MAG TPA: hypothetical protein [Bacteriophage sp.]